MRVAAVLVHSPGLGLLGLGAGGCLQIPGSTQCRNNATGSVVSCDDPACAVGGDGGYSNVPRQYAVDCVPKQYDPRSPAPWPPDDPCIIANMALACVPPDWPAGSKSAARCPDGSPMPYCPALCAGAPPPQFTGGYGGVLPPDATSTQVQQNYRIQPVDNYLPAPRAYDPPPPPPATAISAPVYRTPAPAPAPAPSPEKQAADNKAATTSDAFASVKTFLTDKSFAGVPNWVLIVGALGAVVIVPQLVKGRR